MTAHHLAADISYLPAGFGFPIRGLVVFAWNFGDVLGSTVRQTEPCNKLGEGSGGRMDGRNAVFDGRRLDTL